MDVPRAAEMMDWIAQICAQGIRRPGYPADEWTEGFVRDRFEEFGLQDVRFEDVPLPRWEPRSWSLEAGGERFDCFPLPHTKPGSVEGVLGDDVALERVTLNSWPQSFVRERLALRTIDPDGDFDTLHQTLPFGRQLQAVMEPSIEAGASAFIGIFDAPWESCDYYVPYDGVERPIPGVWVSRSDGERLEQLRGKRVALAVDSVREDIVSHNIVGELRGDSDEWVIVGSHHDGPWVSAVEDASGIALVLAQAKYWAAQTSRPHNMIFVVQAGHMVHGAGCRAFIDAHRDLMDRVVLEVHLEHTAKESHGEDGKLVTGEGPETSWWFVTRNDELIDAVEDALNAEGVTRSFILPPDVFGEFPTTDGGFYHTVGVPLVNFLAAPMYLFDSQDTPDKIHEPSLEAVTRAAIRIIEWTRGRTAAALRG